MLGTLDISGGLYVGVGENAVGILRLSGGEASAQTVTVGESSEGSDESILALNGTRMEVLDSLLIGGQGRVYITVGANPAGFDIVPDDEAAFQMDLEAAIDVHFTQASDFVWGLRMAGNHQALFEGLVSDGQLTATGDHASLAFVSYDGDFTYYAIPEPGTAGLLILGGVALLGFLRRKAAGRGR